MELIARLIELVIEKTVSFVSSLGYWGIALGMAIESANVPLPSEVILPFGGYLVSMGKLSFFQAAFAGAVGGTVGSVFSYYLGLWGGRPFLSRYGRYLGISHRHLLQAENWFARYGEATVFFTRLMPIVRTFISFPAGISGMNFCRFVVYTFLGSLPWCFFLTYLGVKMGQHWEDLKYWFHRLDFFVVLSLMVLIIYFWRQKKRA